MEEAKVPQGPAQPPNAAERERESGGDRYLLDGKTPMGSLPSPLPPSASPPLQFGFEWSQSRRDALLLPLPTPPCLPREHPRLLWDGAANCTRWARDRPRGAGGAPGLLT